MGDIKITDRRSTLFRLMKYIGKYTPLLVVSLILAAAEVVLSLFIPVFAGRAIDRIVGAGRVDFAGITPSLAGIAVAATLSALTQWLMTLINNSITFRVVRDIRNRAFTRLQSVPLKYIDTKSHGEVVSRVISDVDQFSEGLLLGFSQLFTGVVTIIGTLIFMLTINIPIALLVVVLTPMSLFSARLIANKTFHLFKSQSEARGEQTSLIDEVIGNLKTVKAFSREAAVTEEFDVTNEKLEYISRRAVFASSLINPTTRFINGVIYAAVALCGAISVISGGGMTIGGLTCFLSYANQYARPFHEISGVVAELQNSLACAARVFELIDADTVTPDPPEALNDYKAQGAVSFEGVSFSYTPSRSLIKNLSLSVKPGQRVAIVGPTGCGKTTLINLLMRFYEVTGGAIYSDGMDIRDITRSALRSNFGMVLQDTWLKSGTVRENILLGKPDATDDEMITAAKAAHAHGFIRRLEHGYDTVLGENGGSLSAGQRQLLCIARIMLCLPPMLILDEATSSIDTRTERKISDAFSRMMQGRTCFIVAHRLSTIRDADVILVMKDGDIVETGTHDELLKANGFYAGLYRSQLCV